MVHRTVFGSIERFIGILTEHFAGAYPTWLSPVQAVVLPITDKFAGYANEVAAKLEAAGVRVEVDSRNEKIGYKIREAQMQKIPYMLVVGEKEATTQTVGLRKGTLAAAKYLNMFATIRILTSRMSIWQGKVLRNAIVVASGVLLVLPFDKHHYQYNLLHNRNRLFQLGYRSPKRQFCCPIGV